MQVTRLSARWCRFELYSTAQSSKNCKFSRNGSTIGKAVIHKITPLVFHRQNSWPVVICPPALGLVFFTVLRALRKCSQTVPKQFRIAPAAMGFALFLYTQRHLVLDMSFHRYFILLLTDWKSYSNYISSSLQLRAIYTDTKTANESCQERSPAQPPKNVPLSHCRMLHAYFEAEWRSNVVVIGRSRPLGRSSAWYPQSNLIFVGDGLDDGSAQHAPADRRAFAFFADQERSWNLPRRFPSSHVSISSEFTCSREPKSRRRKHW